MFFLINDYIYKKNNTRNINNIQSVYINTPNFFKVFLISILFFNGLPFTLKFNLELFLFIKLLNLDLIILFMFFSIQVMFTLIFNKQMYTVLFCNNKYKKILDLNTKELYFIYLNIIVLFLITCLRNLNLKLNF